MKRLLISGLLSLMLLPRSGWATDATYVNNGTVTFPPQIDATNVINAGTFDFTFNRTEFPFDTSNTRNFTNNGTMIGSVGFRFDNAPNTGPRKPSATFINRLSGRVEAVDELPVIFFGSVNSDSVPKSYLLANSTNVINQGVLTAGAGGLLRLAGTNINLTRGGVQIRPIAGRGSENGIFTNYFLPDVAIYDNYWGQTNQVMDSSAIIQVSGGNVIVTTPVHRAEDNFFIYIIRFGMSNPFGDFYTNTIGTTNLMVTNMNCMSMTTNVPTTNVVQAAFVGLAQPGDFDVGFRFFPSSDLQNPFQTVSVGLTVGQTNVVTAGSDAVSIYLVDTLASETNRSFYTNFLGSTYSATKRPQNYLLSRLQPFEYFFGSAGNADFAENLLYDPSFASSTVTNEYAAYSAYVDNIATRPPSVPNTTIKDLPGRIEIFADSLDMTRTRLRGEGLVTVQAKHLISSSNAVVDAENLSFTLGSTNGTLNVINLTRETVGRVKGDLYVWSGVWTNQQNMLIENWDCSDTNAPPKPANITNVVEVRIHALIMDAAIDFFHGPLLTQVPVLVWEFITHSTNVVVNDAMTVVQSFLIDGQSFTLNGSITFSNTFFLDSAGNRVVFRLDDWVATNAPNLLYFTNNGTLNIPSEGHFGDDRPIPYAAFVNKGTITAAGQTIASSYFENGGSLVTSDGGLLVTTPSGKMENGQINSLADVQFFANVLKFNRGTIQTSSRLDLTVTNSLFDAGAGSGNSFSCGDGFRLLRKPQTGDLLGTTVETVAPAFAEVDHAWAGTDYGPGKAGFFNNTALGTLLLTPGDFEAQFPPLFFLAGTAGTGVTNALYVDFLDLSKLGDYQEELQINPDLMIYFAAADLSFTPPPTNGVPQQPEEYLDGQFEGRLRWVRDFAGPNSSAAVVSNGVSILVNRAVRNSLILDSDGDGIPNGSDFYPFDNALVAKLALAKQPPLTAVLSWNAIAQKVYSVQVTTNFISPNWQTILYYTNSAAVNGTVTVQIPVPPGSLRQFYRVGTTTN